MVRQPAKLRALSVKVLLLGFNSICRGKTILSVVARRLKVYQAHTVGRFGQSMVILCTVTWGRAAVAARQLEKQAALAHCVEDRLWASHHLPRQNSHPKTLPIASESRLCGVEKKKQVRGSVGREGATGTAPSGHKAGRFRTGLTCSLIWPTLLLSFLFLYASGSDHLPSALRLCKGRKGNQAVMRVSVRTTAVRQFLIASWTDLALCTQSWILLQAHPRRGVGQSWLLKEVGLMVGKR